MMANALGEKGEPPLCRRRFAISGSAARRSGNPRSSAGQQTAGKHAHFVFERFSRQSLQT